MLEQVNPVVWIRSGHDICLPEYLEGVDHSQKQDHPCRLPHLGNRDV